MWLLIGGIVAIILIIVISVAVTEAQKATATTSKPASNPTPSTLAPTKIK
jgi:hypothetical protein